MKKYSGIAIVNGVMDTSLEKMLPKVAKGRLYFKDARDGMIVSTTLTHLSIQKASSRFQVREFDIGRIVVVVVVVAFVLVCQLGQGPLQILNNSLLFRRSVPISWDEIAVWYGTELWGALHPL